MVASYLSSIQRRFLCRYHTVPNCMVPFTARLNEIGSARSTERKRSYLILAFVIVIVAWTSSIFSCSLWNKDEAWQHFLPPIDNPSIKAISSDEPFSLARSQSYGFFTDISDSNWRIAQESHAMLFPNFYKNLLEYSNGPHDKGSTKSLAMSSNWYGQNFQVEFICPLARRIPPDSMADGPKWICNLHTIAAQKECLIYSVGSNGKVEFEKAIKEYASGNCEIHTFDTVAWNKRFGNFEEALSPYSTFHHWGLGTKEQATKEPTKYKTLEQTMIELGHANKTIDVFKIDCEWCEWFTWKDWLTVDIRQILVETHNAPMPSAKEFFFGLHDHGYVIFSKEANYMNKAGCVEYSFIKLSQDFFINDTMYSSRNDN